MSTARILALYRDAFVLLIVLASIRTLLPGAATTHAHAVALAIVEIAAALALLWRRTELLDRASLRNGSRSGCLRSFKSASRSQPGNRVRLLVSRRFSWRPGGPVQRFVHDRLLREFLASAFAASQEEFFFHGALVAPEVHGQLKRVLQHAARECMELVERDRSAPLNRIGTAFVLALRPWGYSGFRPFERQT